MVQETGPEVWMEGQGREDQLGFLKKTVWRALSWGGKVRGLVSVSWLQTNEAEDGFSRLYMKRERETLERNERERDRESSGGRFGGVGGWGGESRESEEKSSFYWYKHTKPAQYINNKIYLTFF